MTRTSRAGRALFGAALIGFGLTPFVTGRLSAALVPLPTALPAVVASGLGALLILALLGMMFLSWVAVVHIPRIMAQPGFEPGWTSGLFAVGMAGVALILADGAE